LEADKNTSRDDRTWIELDSLKIIDPNSYGGFGRLFQSSAKNVLFELQDEHGPRDEHQVELHQRTDFSPVLDVIKEAFDTSISDTSVRHHLEVDTDSKQRKQLNGKLYICLKH